MIKTSETMEIMKFKEKWIAGYRVKKLFDRKSVNCKAFVDKLSYGHNLDKMNKMRFPHNVEYVDFRYDGGLLWPSRIVVMLTGVVIKLFEQILASEDFMNDYYTSCSSSSIALLFLKSMVFDIMSNSNYFNA